MDSCFRRNDNNKEKDSGFHSDPPEADEESPALLNRQEGRTGFKPVPTETDVCSYGLILLHLS